MRSNIRPKDLANHTILHTSTRKAFLSKHEVVYLELLKETEKFFVGIPSKEVSKFKISKQKYQPNFNLPSLEDEKSIQLLQKNCWSDEILNKHFSRFDIKTSKEICRDFLKTLFGSEYTYHYYHQLDMLRYELETNDNFEWYNHQINLHLEVSSNAPKHLYNLWKTFKKSNSGEDRKAFYDEKNRLIKNEYNFTESLKTIAKHIVTCPYVCNYCTIYKNCLETISFVKTKNQVFFNVS